MNKTAFRQSLPKYSIPNLAQACRVLKSLADRPRAVSVSALAAETGLPRTTLLRIVTTLIHEGFLSGDSAGVILGPGLIPLGHGALTHIDLRAAASPFVQRLARETGETAHLAIPMRGAYKSLLVEVCQSPNPLRAGAPAGTLVDLYCSATGKVFLAHPFAAELPAAMAAGHPVAHTPRTITDPVAMQTEILRVRELGYAVDDEELADGLRCLAAPVRDNTGEVVAALGVTGPSARFGKDKVERFAALAAAAARDISRALGHSPRIA